jgi:hypothetical protein
MIKVAGVVPDFAAADTRAATELRPYKARRQEEFEEFKKELNETRRRTDGPNARVPYPESSLTIKSSSYRSEESK